MHGKVIPFLRLWYLEPGKAFGFADRSELRTDRRRGADTAEGRLRVSWHLDGHGGRGMGPDSRVRLLLGKIWSCF